MKYSKEIAAFKAKIINQYKNGDSTKPVKGTKSVEIRITGRENNTAIVELCYSERFRRMWGQYNFADVRVFEGDLKEACQVAKELKAECGLRISYLAFEEFMTNLI